MTNHHQPLHLVADDGDAELTRALRALYRAPDAPFYWSALEQRIIDRIAADESLDAWWSVPAQWVRIGLIAAGFGLIVAGSLVLRSRAEMQVMAYEQVVGPAAGGPTIAIREPKNSLEYINGR